MKTLNPIEREIQFQELDEKLQDCLLAIAREVNKAEEKHPRWPVNTQPYVETVGDFVYAAGIITEEAGELMKECIQYQYESRSSLDDIEKEAVQTGAMAVRFLKNL